MSRCKFSSGKSFEGGASCLKQTTARKKSRLLSRSLAFISIFCVLALLFTSLTPLSVFAEDPVPATEEIQVEAGSPKTNGGNAEQPPVDPGKKGESVDPEEPETPVGEPEKDSKKPEQAGQPADLKDSKPQSADPKNQGTPDPQVDLKSIPENNDSAPKPTLVINEVPAGAIEISGEIKTEGPLPTYNLILEIVDKSNFEKYSAEPELEVDLTTPDNTKWTVRLPDKLPPLVAGDKITITIKFPGSDLTLSKSTEVQSTQSGDNGLEISGDDPLTPVRGDGVKAPTVNPVLYDDTTISGANLAKAKVKVGKKNVTVIATVHVSLKDSSGTEKANLSVTPTEGTTWKVDLPEGVKVAAGDKVTVYQQIGDDKSPDVTADAQPSKASTVTLTMPSGELWIEQYVANIVNADEKTEAEDLLKKANPTVAKDIKSVEFKITGIDPKTASYTVTYKDNSKTGEIQAPGLTIKQVTETSRTPVIDSITVVDNEVKGKLPGPGPFNGIKVQLVLKVNKDKAGQYCNENKCTVDKDSSKPVGITLQSDGTFSYTLQARESLELDQIVGVSVKEPHKFVSCSTTTVKPVKVEKTEVRDPRKLTAKDKEAIDAAIRKAYTVNGESKLPNGTGDWDGVPAVIQFDDSGNVKIFSGNDVAGTWDSNNDYKFVPEKNEDGSVKVNAGAEPKITIQAKDLVKNIAPKSPAIAVDIGNGKVTITPPAYKDPGDDTDLLSYTITYKDASGAEKTVTATRDLQTNKWNGPGVNEESGVITLSVEKIEPAGTIKATAKDNGGLEGDTDKLDSDPATKKLETATVSYNGNDGTGEMDGKKLNKGSKYKILDNKFTAPENMEFKGWKIGETEYQVGDEITVKEDTTVIAQWAKKPDQKNPDDKPQNPPVNPGDKPRGFVPIPGGNTPNLQVIPGANPQILRVQPAPSASAPRVYKTLPRTGESNGRPFLAAALLALLGGALILSRKRS